MSWLPLDRSPPLFQLPMTCTMAEGSNAARITGPPLAARRGEPFSCSTHTNAVTVLCRLKLAQVQRPSMRQPSSSRVIVPVGFPLPLKACILPDGNRRRIGSIAVSPANLEAADEISADQAT